MIKVFSQAEEPSVTLAEGDVVIWFKTPNEAYIARWSTKAIGDWVEWVKGKSIQQSLEGK